MGTTHTLDIYVVRHGITRSNLEKRYLGHTDEPLLQQRISELLPMKNQLEDIPFDTFFTSDLTRCMETFHYLLPDQRVCVDQRLREISFGEWECATHDELQHDPAYKEWMDDWEYTAPSGGEVYTDFHQRVGDFLDGLLKESTSLRKVLIVTHGGVIRSFFKHFYPQRSMWDIYVPHGRGFHISLGKQKEEWRCTSWSEVPMLGREKSSANDIHRSSG